MGFSAFLISITDTDVRADRCVLACFKQLPCTPLCPHSSVGDAEPCDALHTACRPCKRHVHASFWLCDASEQWSEHLRAQEKRLVCTFHSNLSAR